LDDLDQVRKVISSYADITIEPQKKEGLFPFLYQDRHFLLYYPDSDKAGEMPIVLVRSEDVNRYPHILFREISGDRLACPMNEKYFYICLRDSIESVASLYSYEEKIHDTIDRLLHLLNMNHVQQEKEYQKEFLLHWNSRAEAEPIVDVFLSQTGSFSRFHVYGYKNCFRLIEKSLVLTDLSSKTKGKLNWQRHVEMDAYYIPLIDNRGILPMYNGAPWTAADLQKTIFSTQIAYLSDSVYENMKMETVNSKDVLLVFSMIINGIVIPFTVLLECKARGKRKLLEKIESDLCNVKMLCTHRRDYEYLNAVIGNLTEHMTQRALLVGAGSLGSYIAPELVKNGWKALTIYDGDSLVNENTLRWSYGTYGVYANKSQRLKMFLVQIHPEVEINAVDKNLNDEFLKKEVEKNDLIIFTIGSSDEQLRFNRILKELSCSIPVLYVWLEAGGAYSHILMVNYQDTGCYQCLFTEENSGRLTNNRSTINTEDIEDHVIRNGCSGTRAAYGTSVILRTVAVLLEKLKEIETKKDEFETTLVNITPNRVYDSSIRNKYCQCCNHSFDGSDP
jgi:molybdopterin-synthase adenylyltransferase